MREWRVDVIEKNEQKGEVPCNAGVCYKEKVFQLLASEKERIHNMQNRKEKVMALQALPLKIEELTLTFEVSSLYAEIPQAVKALINAPCSLSEEKNAQAYILYKAKKPNMNIPQSDLDSVASFSDSTLEAIMIYVMSTLFSPLEEKPTVRLATLIDRLERCVRRQASLSKPCKPKPQEGTTGESKSIQGKKARRGHPFGSLLVTYLIKKKFIDIIHVVDDKNGIVVKGKVRKVKGGKVKPYFKKEIACAELSKFYYNDRTKKKYLKYYEILDRLLVDIQLSRYETMVLNLAEAYEGYDIYFPAFVDFRGRIYRSGR